MDPLELPLAGLDLRCFLTSTAETLSFEAILTTGREFGRSFDRTHGMDAGDKARLLPRWPLSERRSTWAALVVLQDAPEENYLSRPAQADPAIKSSDGAGRSAGHARRSRNAASRRRSPYSKIAPQQTSQIVAKRVGHRLMSSPNTETHRGQYLAGGRALSSLVALFHLSDPNRR